MPEQRARLRQGRRRCRRRQVHDRGATSGALFASSGDQTRWGGTVGVGFEYGFAPNWSVGVEYDHMFLGTQGVTFTTPAGAAFGSDNIRQDVDLFTARVNYKFGGPVVGRY